MAFPYTYRQAGMLHGESVSIFPNATFSVIEIIEMESVGKQSEF